MMMIIFFLLLLLTPLTPEPSSGQLAHTPAAVHPQEQQQQL